MQSRAVSVLIAALIVASQSTVEAQAGVRIQVPSRFQVGGDFVVSQPKSELATNIGSGYGFNLTGMFKIDPRGYFNLRADGGIVQYGRERQRVPLFPISGRINVDIDTRRASRPFVTFETTISINEETRAPRTGFSRIDIGPVTEVMGQGAWLIPVEQTALQAALVELVSEPAQRTAWSLRAAVQARTAPGIQEVVDRYVQLFTQ